MASLVIGFAISMALLFGGWFSAHALGFTIIPGVAVVEQVRNLLNRNLPFAVQFIVMMLINSGLWGVVVYAVWTLIDRQMRRRKV